MIAVFTIILSGKNPMKLENKPSVKLPFLQTREVKHKIHAFQHSVELILRLYFKLHLTGPSGSMVSVIICEYQFFRTLCYDILLNLWNHLNCLLNAYLNMLSNFHHTTSDNIGSTHLGNLLDQDNPRCPRSEANSNDDK